MLASVSPIALAVRGLGGRRGWAQQMAALGATWGVNFATGETLGTTLGDITATRASGGTALDLAGNVASFGNNTMRIGAGRGLLTEAAATNSWLRSQEFDNAAWTKDRSSITANFATAPDGTATADRLIEDATASNTHRVQQAVTTTTAAWTFSVYAKAGARSWIYMRIDRNGGTTPLAWFNLASGVVGTAQTGLTSRIEALANGWYRCIMTVDTATAAGNAFVIGLTTGDGVSSYTGDNASDALIWGAQGELGSVATSYIATTTAAATRAFDNVFTWTAATNLVLQSQALATSPWGFFTSGTGSSPTRTNNFAVAPDGTTTATRIQVALNGGTSTGDRSLVNQSITLVTSAVYTFSFWIWAAVPGNVRVAIDNTSISSILAVTTTPTRVSLTGTASGTASSMLFEVRGGQVPACADSMDLRIWGVQLETGTFATPYIPTTTVAVTQNAPWWTSTEGIFVATVRDLLSPAVTSRIVSLNNAGSYGTGNGFNLTVVGSTTIGAGGTGTSINLTVATIGTARRRFAGGYRTSDTRQSASGDGSFFGTNTTLDYTGVGANRLQFGSLTSGATQPLNGYLENIAFIPTPGLLAAGATMDPLTVLT